MQSHSTNYPASSTDLLDQPLVALVSGIRRVVRSETNPKSVGRAVAGLLRPYLAGPNLLSPAQLEPDPLRYRQQILHVEDDGTFSVAALIWLPGQATPIHDHVSWCVVGVYRGAEHQISYQLREEHSRDPYLIELGRQVNLAGTVEALVPPGDIHQVTNGGDSLAVSLHVYGADVRALGCSIRRRYDLPIR